MPQFLKGKKQKKVNEKWSLIQIPEINMFKKKKKTGLKETFIISRRKQNTQLLKGTKLETAQTNTSLRPQAANHLTSSP